MKLKEEEQRAVRYLETRKGCDSVAVVSRILPKANIPNGQVLERKMFFVWSQAWDKEKVLSPHQESNHGPSDFVLQCSTTEPQRDISYSMCNHKAIDIADPTCGSMQDVCHI